MNKIANLYHSVFGDPMRPTEHPYSRDLSLLASGAIAGGIIDQALTPARRIAVTIKDFKKPVGVMADDLVSLMRRAVK